jgi:hypothetical protein
MSLLVTHFALRRRWTSQPVFMEFSNGPRVCCLGYRYEKYLWSSGVQKAAVGGRHTTLGCPGEGRSSTA